MSNLSRSPEFIAALDNAIVSEGVSRFLLESDGTPEVHLELDERAALNEFHEYVLDQYNIMKSIQYNDNELKKSVWFRWMVIASGGFTGFLAYSDPSKFLTMLLMTIVGVLLYFRMSKECHMMLKNSLEDMKNSVDKSIRIRDSIEKAHDTMYKYSMKFYESKIPHSVSYLEKPKFITH